MKTISKAQEKREKQKLERLTNRMSRQLIDFKSTYIGDFVQYEVRQIQKVAETFHSLDMEVVSESVVGKSLSVVREERIYTPNEMNLFDCPKNNSYGRYDDTIRGINTYERKQAIRQTELIELCKAEFYATAVKSYNDKFDKLISGMMHLDFDSSMVVEDVSTAGGQFEILVYNPKVRSYNNTNEEVLESCDFFYHARMIYACGEIVRPHFRFITTTRKTYIKS